MSESARDDYQVRMLTRHKSVQLPRSRRHTPNAGFPVLPCPQRAVDSARGHGLRVAHSLTGGSDGFGGGGGCLGWPAAAAGVACHLRRSEFRKFRHHQKQYGRLVR